MLLFCLSFFLCFFLSLCLKLQSYSPKRPSSIWQCVWICSISPVSSFTNQEVKGHWRYPTRREIPHSSWLRRVENMPCLVHLPRKSVFVCFFSCLIMKRNSQLFVIVQLKYTLKMRKCLGGSFKSFLRMQCSHFWLPPGIFRKEQVLEWLQQI